MPVAHASTSSQSRWSPNLPPKILIEESGSAELAGGYYESLPARQRDQRVVALSLAVPPRLPFGNRPELDRH